MPLLLRLLRASLLLPTLPQSPRRSARRRRPHRTRTLRLPSLLTRPPRIRLRRHVSGCPLLLQLWQQPLLRSRLPRRPPPKTHRRLPTTRLQRRQVQTLLRLSRPEISRLRRRRRQRRVARRRRAVTAPIRSHLPRLVVWVRLRTSSLGSRRELEDATYLPPPPADGEVSPTAYMPSGADAWFSALASFTSHASEADRGTLGGGSTASRSVGGLDVPANMPAVAQPPRTKEDVAGETSEEEEKVEVESDGKGSQEKAAGANVPAVARPTNGDEFADATERMEDGAPAPLGVVASELVAGADQEMPPVGSRGHDATEPLALMPFLGLQPLILPHKIRRASRRTTRSSPQRIPLGSRPAPGRSSQLLTQLHEPVRRQPRPRHLGALLMAMATLGPGRTGTWRAPRR